MDLLYDWTPEQRGEFEREQKKANEILRNYYMYTNFIDNTEETFCLKRRMLMKIIENAINCGKMGKDVMMMSRIKSSKSVYDNKIANKNLDDIFATTILANTDEELEYIKRQIEQDERIKIVRKKKLQKEKFVAEHIYLLMEYDNNVIECRLQTVEELEHAYSHALYKENGDEDITEEQRKKIEQEKQDLYDSGSARIYAEIPLKWEAYYDKKSKSMKEKGLTKQEVLKELYPFLKLKDMENEKEK